MTAPDLDPLLVAEQWLPRLPYAARGMLATLMGALERERALHAIARAELERERIAAAAPAVRALRLAADPPAAPELSPQAEPELVQVSDQIEPEQEPAA